MFIYIYIDTHTHFFFSSLSLYYMYISLYYMYIYIYTHVKSMDSNLLHIHMTHMQIYCDETIKDNFKGRVLVVGNTR